jgi:hypothetical protein
MTRIPTPADFDRAHQNEAACAGISRNLVASTAAMVDPKTLGVASGTFVSIDDRLFFATAAHCISDESRGRLSFVPNSLTPVEDSIVPILGYGVAAEHDVGYLEVTPGAAAEIGKTAISLERINPRGTGEVGRLVFIVGYPGELIKPEPVGERTLNCEYRMMLYTNAPLAPAEWPAKMPDPSSESDIVVRYDRDEALWPFANQLNVDRLADPRGTSGGGWWQGADCADGLWHPDRIQLIGIQSSWHEKENYIRGCQIQHWLRLLYANEPELRATLVTRFRRALFGRRWAR